MKRLALLAIGLSGTFALTSCGLQPMYAGGGDGMVARSLAANSPIGKAGLVRQLNRSFCKINKLQGPESL